MYIDADFLIYECTESKLNKTGGFSKGDAGSVGAKKKYKPSLKPFKEKMKRLVQDIEDEAAVALIGQYRIGKTHLVFTADNNFRYDIYAAYKANRANTEKTKEFYRLRKWAQKKFTVIDKCEADDVCSFYARKGHLVVSMDKDVYKSSPGLFFNPHYLHRCVIETSHMEARQFTLIQTLTGDSSDNILALPKKKGDPMVDGVPAPGTRKPFKVTEKLAMELLDEFGWDWVGIVKAFESKGFSEKEALLNRRLIGMDQAYPLKDGKKWKIKLFTPKKGIKL